MENSKHKKTRSKDKFEKGKQRLKKEQQNNEVRQLQVPVELPGPQCEVCEETKADFYCTKCEAHYCQNCESEVHTLFWKKKHKEFIFKEPYTPQKKINHNICDKHKEKLSLYCQNENRLICSECYEICRKNNHSILGLNEYSNEIYEKKKMIFK
ncbi:b-box zinc finger protein [Anaeramoeba flamelloides]|uniref:B-box zinc finger protein n=1 Tax=Anaeramoeba flamelloides TaxID=1746091 RepID=A0AAV7ZMB1_9EUKA|nr:b-box zinc finger protein [Anaeramoeba flamelloides]